MKYKVILKNDDIFTKLMARSKKEITHDVIEERRKTAEEFVRQMQDFQNKTGKYSPKTSHYGEPI